MKNLFNKRIAIFLTMLFLSSEQLFAQSRHNTISIHYSRYSFIDEGLSKYGYITSPRVLLGIKYQYLLAKYFSIYGNFTTNHIPNRDGYSIFVWNLKPLEEKYINHSGNSYYYYNSNGHLDLMVNYYFFDIGGSYRYAINSKNRLTTHFALSNAFGTNSYIYQAYNGQGETVVTDSRSKKEDYWGAVAGVSYNYYFWKGRMNAGATINLRYYGNQMPFFTDYGLHVGYNF